MKRCFALICLLLMLLIRPAAAEEIFPGDADLDGDVTSADAALVLRYIVGLAEIDGQSLLNADANRDGSVTSADAALILRAIVGLDTLSNAAPVREATSVPTPESTAQPQYTFIWVEEEPAYNALACSACGYVTTAYTEMQDHLDRHRKSGEHADSGFVAVPAKGHWELIADCP